MTTPTTTNTNKEMILPRKYNLIYWRMVSECTHLGYFEAEDEHNWDNEPYKSIENPAHTYYMENRAEFFAKYITDLSDKSFKCFCPKSYSKKKALEAREAITTNIFS